VADPRTDPAQSRTNPGQHAFGCTPTDRPKDIGSVRSHPPKNPVHAMEVLNIAAETRVASLMRVLRA
jgi:hypothetical protein